VPDPDEAATRVWAAAECLRKTGTIGPTPLTAGAAEDGWVVFTAGIRRIATVRLRLHGEPDPLVLAVLTG
jgi:enediyne polyketide synthase